MQRGALKPQTDGYFTHRQCAGEGRPIAGRHAGGWRHIMLDDTDISATRHARAAVGGVIAGITGCPADICVGRGRTQGPPGGGPGSR